MFSVVARDYNPEIQNPSHFSQSQIQELAASQLQEFGITSEITKIVLFPLLDDKTTILAISRKLLTLQVAFTYQ